MKATTLGRIVQIATSSSKDAEGTETENLYALDEVGDIYYWRNENAYASEPEPKNRPAGWVRLTKDLVPE